MNKVRTRSRAALFGFIVLSLIFSAVMPVLAQDETPSLTALPTIQATTVPQAVQPPVTQFEDIEPEVAVLPASLERISWGAVIAGAVISLVLQLAFNLLFIAIGVSTINPRFESDSPTPQALGSGAIGAVVISAVISLFIGGWLAGRFAGIPDNWDGILHGFMVWGVVSLLTMVLLTTTVGRIISGVSTVISQGLHLAGQATQAVAQGVGNVAQGVGSAAQNVAHGVGNVAQSASDAAQNAANQVGDANGFSQQDRDKLVQTIQEEGRRLLAQAGIPVENLQNQARDAGQELQQAARQVAENPGDAERIVREAINRVFARGQDVVNQTDRQALVDALTQRAGISQEQARQTIQQWETRVNQAQAQVRQRADQLQAEARRKADEIRRDAERAAREAAEATTKAIARLALAGFAALIIGGLAAGLGGLIGAPEEIPVAEVNTSATSSIFDANGF